MELPQSTEYNTPFSVPVVNASGVSTRRVYEEMSRGDSQVLSALQDWVGSLRPSHAAMQASQAGSPTARSGGLFYRDRYLTPTNPYDQMRVAMQAVEQDDVVGNAAETTEALAFSTSSMMMIDPDQQDVMNQWAAKVDLDSILRQMWRQLFEVSQCYVAGWWETQKFTVRGEGEGGRTRRKEFEITGPSRLTLLDPLKVVPTQPTVFNDGGLAWIATRVESARFNDILSDDHEDQDEIVRRLIVGKYKPGLAERKELQSYGIDTNSLWELDSKKVFRHTLTRSAFQRFAPLRMRSIFELLDQKQQLRQMERQHLIGGTNFILLIRQGTDQWPGEPDEIARLKSEVRTFSRTPVLVGDHRLTVEIVTPKLDSTLKAERWNTLDSRITARLYQMFALGNYAAGAAGDDSAKLVKVVARGLESRRHMIRRSLEANIFRPMFDGNDDLKMMPKLMYHPRAIALDFDPNWAAFILDLANKGDISRETELSEFDMDQDTEAILKKREKDNGYDEVFKTQIPFSTPNNADPATPLPRDNGGGRRNGGGAAPGSGQGQPARNPNHKSDGKNKRKAAAGLILTITDADGKVVGSADLESLLVDNGDDDDASSVPTEE